MNNRLSRSLFCFLVCSVILCARDFLGFSKTQIEIQTKDGEGVTNSHNETRTLYGVYSVVRVVDGDTIVVDIDGEETKVRMIGVDTPESVHADENKNSESGITASQYTKNLLTGQSVYLEYDIDVEDDYGRSLAYVYLDDGTTMVNSLLLQEGMAQTMTIQPNSKYADLFANYQKTAREEQKGFWNAGGQ